MVRTKLHSDHILSYCSCFTCGRRTFGLEFRRPSCELRQCVWFLKSCSLPNSSYPDVGHNTYWTPYMVLWVPDKLIQTAQLLTIPVVVMRRLWRRSLASVTSSWEFYLRARETSAMGCLLSSWGVDLFLFFFQHGIFVFYFCLHMHWVKSLESPERIQIVNETKLSPAENHW